MSDPSQPVDLARVRRARADLEALLAEHPEIRDRTAAFLAGEPTPEDLEALMAQRPGQPVKMPAELLDRIDSFVPRLEKYPEILAYGRVSRASVIRLALTKGLEALERDLDRRESKEG